MCQFKLQLCYHCQLLIKKMFIAYLLMTPCLFAAELAAGLVYQDKNGNQLSAPLLNSSVEMHVHGLINRVTVTQVFENSSDNWINATYLFPLPENAAVDHLTMTINERVIIGEIKEKSAAKQLFTQAKISGKKASLVKQRRNNLFTSAVANIAPGEKVRIEIEYQQAIAYKMGGGSLHYPMTITPRYAPPVPRLSRAQREEYLSCLATGSGSEQQQLLCEKSWASWLQAVEDQQLEQQTIEMIKDRNDPDLLLDINVYLHNPLAIKNVSSPYHRIKIEKQDASLQLISLQDNPVTAKRDFVLNWQLLQGENARSALFVEQRGAEKFGALMMLPPAQQFIESARINKEVIFVIDVSGSMSGTSLTQAKTALSFAVDQLAEGDTFNIIAFSDNSEFFASNSLPVDQRSKVMAKVFIEQLQASGGTNMRSALHAALAGNRTVYANKKQGLRQIIFITDASISNEQQLLTQIEQQLADSRLFMVAIGSAPNRYFMKASAKQGKGSYTHIGDVNQVSRKMTALFAQLSTPVLRDIKLHWSDGSEVDYWPQPVTDLYQAEPLQLVFKIPEGKERLHISGLRFVENSAQQWSQDISLQQQQNAQGVAVLWAKAQIDSLDLNRELSDSEKQQKITGLGLAFHIVTEHTSLIAVQQKVSRPATLDSIETQVKSHLPQGSSMRLPQTGLASGLYIDIGMLLLLLAALLWAFAVHYQQVQDHH